jgi:hypothetical protein
MLWRAKPPSWRVTGLPANRGFGRHHAVACEAPQLACNWVARQQGLRAPSCCGVRSPPSWRVTGLPANRGFGRHHAVACEAPQLACNWVARQQGLRAPSCCGVRSPQLACNWVARQQGLRAPSCCGVRSPPSWRVTGLPANRASGAIMLWRAKPPSWRVTGLPANRGFGRHHAVACEAPQLACNWVARQQGLRAPSCCGVRSPPVGV